MLPDRVKPVADTAHPAAPNRWYRAAIAVALMLWPVLAAAATTDEGTLERRRQRIEQLDPAEKKELLAKKERFQSLPLDKQQRMRLLHRQIEADPHARRLRQVAHHYYEWLKTLTASERAELKGLPADERLARIRDLRQRMALRRLEEAAAGALVADDTKKIDKWITEIISARRDELIQQLSPEQRAWLERVPPDQPERRDWRLLGTLLRNRRSPLPVPRPDEVDRLIATLSPTAQEYIQGVNAENKANVVRSWIRAAVLSRFGPPRVSPEELERFYQNLDRAEKERFERMPAYRMEHELRREYFRRELGRRRWGDFGPPGPPGPPPDNGPPPDHGPGLDRRPPRAARGSPDPAQPSTEGLPAPP